MARVLFTHRYPMRDVRVHCEAGELPRHHLWGADALEAAGFDVEYGFFGRDRRLPKHVSWRLGDRLGDLEQQWVMARRADRDTVIFAGEASLVRGLSRLPRRPPIVAVVHRAAPWARRLDVAICLSARVRDAVRADAVLAPWGPDLGFAGYAPTGEELVVSAGRTERDTDTLRRALEGTGLPARIHRDQRLRPFPEVLDDLRRAMIVAIPLPPTDRLLGLTEVNDALALAKPIVMTRNDDFDPEAVGCGIAVDAGDVAGWRDALLTLAGDPGLRAQMGRRGREFAETGYNAAAFGAAVVDAVRAVA